MNFSIASSDLTNLLNLPKTQRKTKERKGQDRRGLRKEEVLVREKRELTEVRKSSSGRLFMLKNGVSSTGRLTKFKVCAQELLDAKLK